MAKQVSTTREDRQKALEQKFKSLGIGSHQYRDGGSFNPVGFLPTGQMEIDSILGEGGGIPYGTVVEFCGESMSGKTYLGYKIMAQAQARGEWVCYVNVENSFYPPRAQALGLNTDDPVSFKLMENIDTAEDYGEAVYALIESELFRVIVVDSVSALIPSAEFEKDLNDPATIGLHARFIKRWVKKMLGLAQKSNTIVILINQLYMGAGAIPGQMTPVATGGNAMNFFPHMRLWFKRISGAAGKVMDNNGNIIGGKSKVTLVKTRYSEPFVENEFPIMFGDAESDPIAEFIFRTKAKGAEYVKEARKKLSYIDPNTGEVTESKNPAEFIEMLKEVDAPEKRTRGDNSTTAFEYICGRLKMTADQVEILNGAVERRKAEQSASGDDED